MTDETAQLPVKHSIMMKHGSHKALQNNNLQVPTIYLLLVFNIDSAGIMMHTLEVSVLME